VIHQTTGVDILGRADTLIIRLTYQSGQVYTVTKYGCFDVVQWKGSLHVLVISHNASTLNLMCSLRSHTVKLILCL